MPPMKAMKAMKATQVMKAVKAMKAMKAQQAGKVMNKMKAMKAMKAVQNDVIKETEIRIPTNGTTETLVKVWVDPTENKLKYKWYYCYKK